jgi:hypothetical protein
MAVTGCRTRRARSRGIFAILLLLCAARAQEPVTTGGSQATPARWKETSWWPTNGAPARSEFAGAESCSKCHAGIAATQRKTPMFHAASRPSESELLRGHTSMPFSEGEYSYALSRRPEESRFVVKDDKGEVSAPIDWAFGSGEVAQTYVLKRKDAYLESRLTYYTSLMALGITTGHSSALPQSLEETLGDAIDAETAPRCFGCHTTGSSASGKFDPDHATLGLTCEACHGPGVKHVDAMKSGVDVPVEKTIFSAKELSPVDSVDFCGACHRTPVDVAAFMPANMGIAKLRFQPYRLERSLCWGEKGDARITCVACHDPHQPLVRDLGAYDAKCLKCHAGRGMAPSATLIAGCTVGKKDCASCHMPKYEIPAVHAMFTDHYIRVVPEGSGFLP